MKLFPIKSLVAAAALAAAPLAFAHGDGVPKHGGVVKSANDLSFELVAAPAGAEVYIDDHGQALPTQGFTGKLTVLGVAGKQETALKPAAGDKLVAAGARLAPGDKAVVVVTSPTRQTTSVRFTLP